ncbi:MAG: proteasome assembly chaperone family protein [Halobacteriales archaeon]
MDDIDIEAVADSDLTDPLLVEGLPGVGHVGKLAARHLVQELDGEPVRRIYSTEFPPQVSVEDDGTTELAHATVHAVSADERDLLVLTGDHQASSGPGHYKLANAFLDVAAEFGVERVITLGGVPTGELVEERAVLGAATDDGVVEELRDLGVEFRDGKPEGGIVGVSGLLLGLGERRGFEGACLMGETSGYLVDPKSARAVLQVLAEHVEFEPDYDELEEQAEELEEVVGKIQEMEQGGGGSGVEVPTDEDLRYIG